MKITVRLASLMLAALVSLSSSFAQSPQDVRITISHPGFGALKADLKSVIDLTLPKEQEQWENIEGYIDTFAAGIDSTRPVYVNAVTWIKPNTVLIWAPLATSQPVFKEFRENLESLGYEITRDSKDHSLYLLSQDPEFGWLRVLPDIRYAVFVMTTDKAALPGLKTIILKAVIPADKVKGNMMAELVNADGKPEAIGHRREAFGEVRRVSMEKIKKRPSESPTEFELRQLAVKQQMDEGERLMAESSKIAIVLTLADKVPGAPTAVFTTTASALPGTSLATTIADIGTRPDPFAGLAKFKDSVLSGRINHPIDPMRQANSIALVDLLERDMADRLKESKERSDAEKKAANDVTKGVLDIIRNGIKSGWVDGFIESVPDGKGSFVSISALSAPNAAALDKVLPGLATAGKGNLVELNVDKQGDVAIHRVQLAEGFVDLFDKFYGVKTDLFVGVGPGHIWLASGTGSKDKLKQTIADLGAPQMSTHPLRLEIKLLPWVKRLDEIAKTDPPGKTKEELEQQREWARRRARAIAAYQNGGDTLLLDTTVKDGEVVAELSLETGLLRFVGKMMSAFSEENFE